LYPESDTVYRSGPFCTGKLNSAYSNNNLYRAYRNVMFGPNPCAHALYCCTAALNAIDSDLRTHRFWSPALQSLAHSALSLFHSLHNTIYLPLQQRLQVCNMSGLCKRWKRHSTRTVRGSSLFVPAPIVNKIREPGSMIFFLVYCIERSCNIIKLDFRFTCLKLFLKFRMVYSDVQLSDKCQA
jgi:hypothetical protein